MKRTYLTILLALLCGCGSGGGGGGDGEFVGAAKVNLTVSPDSIDTHDRAKVTIKIKNVIDTGILLKVRFPEELSYAVNTAKLKIDTEDTADTVSPSHNQTNNDTTYLVFFLNRDQFGDMEGDNGESISEPSTLTFELIGDAKLNNGTIEVDADVNDPTIDDSIEFDINEPAFDPESEASISVKESRS